MSMVHGVMQIGRLNRQTTDLDVGSIFIRVGLSSGLIDLREYLQILTV
jgi:hypothetical protein